ncbi:MAG: hypothetical protein ACI9KE_006749, partial [Polyangiales bacterium]
MATISQVGDAASFALAVAVLTVGIRRELWGKRYQDASPSGFKLTLGEA